MFRSILVATEVRAWEKGEWDHIGKGICDEVEMEVIEFSKARLNCLSVQDSKK